MIHLPMLDTSRARVELGRQPRYDATDALREVLAGFAAGSGGTTAPLRCRWRLRSHEFASGIDGSE